MKHLVALLALLLLPASAAACEPTMWPQLMFPVFHEDTVMPRNGFFYGGGWTDSGELQSLRHPDGSRIKWLDEPAPFDETLTRYRPLGGWQPGVYLRVVDMGAAGEETEEGWTAVDERDEEPPVAARVSWQGVDPTPPQFCVSEEPAGVDVTVETDEPAIVYWSRVNDEGAVVASGRWGRWQRPVRTDGIETFDLQFRVVDVAGNEAGTDALTVTSCSGCSGAFAPSVIPGLAPLLLVLARRRRRGPAAPSPASIARR